MSIYDEVEAEVTQGPQVESDPVVMEEEQETGGGFQLKLGWLKTPTGDGEISDRLDHPLNPGRSMGVAQMLRGVEGFTDSLRLAVLDIGLGAAEMMKERQKHG